MTHGMARKGNVAPEWVIWNAMRQRCKTPTNKAWKDYGGRGIRVCDRWSDDFSAFYADMGPRPSPKHSIDRIDNDGPYSPDNCRWVLRRIQQRNTSRNRFITFAGDTCTLAEWGERTGLRPDTIAWRLAHGKTVEQALAPKR